MTCVATGVGNPFIGIHADSYRNTIDIGVGVWDEQINNCIWALPTLALEGRKTFLLNNDSFGFNLDCPDNENFFWTGKKGKENGEFIQRRLPARSALLYDALK